MSRISEDSVGEYAIENDGTDAPTDTRSVSTPRWLVNNLTNSRVGRRSYLRRLKLTFVLLLLPTFLFVLAWFFVLVNLATRLTPSTNNNGYQKIVQALRYDQGSSAWQSMIDPNSSNDILPIPCHSHNDYSREVPLFEALANGCTGVEADIWSDQADSQSNNLLIGHSRRTLTSNRNLSSLYISPLLRILDSQNENHHRTMSNDETMTMSGVYSSDPNQTLVLMLDFKEDGYKLWSQVRHHIKPLREKKYLRYWNGKVTIPGPITIVASGEVNLDLITSNQDDTYRDIFLDAPLDQLYQKSLDDQTYLYNISNSYYASVSMTKSIGRVWMGKFSGFQLSKMKSQIKLAHQLGLTSRYWATPSWPVSWRIRVWNRLIESDVGMLNVDDLFTAGRWNWDWCVVAGITFCGS